MIPAADAASHSVQVKARLPRDQRVYSGLFGRLLLPTGKRETIAVPEKAIWREGSLTGRLRRRRGQGASCAWCSSAPARDGAVEVNSGLNDGDVIAADADRAGRRSAGAGDRDGAAMKPSYGFAGRLASAFIDSKLTPLIIIAALAAGVFATISLPREEEPQIIVPMIDVIVQAPA